MRVGDNLLTNGSQTDGGAGGAAGATAAADATANLNYGDIIQGTLELSNVDLTQQFSDLIVAQRGYQASSRIVSTANELLQDLFDMKRASSSRTADESVSR